MLEWYDGGTKVGVFDESTNTVAVSGAFFQTHASFDLAQDPANGHLYATNGSTITVYDPDGNQIAVSGFSGLGQTFGIAIEP